MPEENEKNLTLEEIEADEILKEYDSEIAVLQQKIDAIKELSPKPRYMLLDHSSGFPTKDETKVALQRKIEILEKQGKGKIAAIAVRSSPSIQGKLYEKAESWREQSTQSQDRNQQTDRSLGFIERLHERGRFARLQKEFENTERSAGINTAENKMDVTVQPSNYYSHLHYIDIDNGKVTDSGKTVGKDMDDPELDR